MNCIRQMPSAALRNSGRTLKSTGRVGSLSVGAAAVSGAACATAAAPLPAPSAAAIAATRKKAKIREYGGIATRRAASVTPDLSPVQAAAARRSVRHPVPGSGISWRPRRSSGNSLAFPRAPGLHDDAADLMKVPAPAWIAAAAGLALAAWTPARTAASQQQPVPSFRSTASLVALNVTVQDARSRYVTGLQPADFAVFEEGRRQDVRFFETAALPIDLILLIDTSRSMSPRLRMAQAAARGFLQTLRPRDRGAVIAFNETVRVLQPLTEDRSALEAAVDATAAGGTTALHTALYVALKQFGISVRPDGAVRRQAVVVLSDGEDTASLLTFDDVLALARQTGVNVYTVRVQANAGIAR